MAAEIWNEGRVVGYSAYEIYVKQFFSEPQPDPNIQPASERQWLASSLTMGSSMLLKLPTVMSSYTKFTDSIDCHDYYIDIPLPAGSKLIGANTLIASFFAGDAEPSEEDSNWASKVTSYGDLIPNNQTISPSDNDIPVDTALTISQTLSVKLQNYAKIIDGIIYVPQNWSSTNSLPAKELDPNFASVPSVRLFVHGELNIAGAPWILLTGFALKSVVFGESIKGVSTNTSANNHLDGGFLGPSVFPWASKIVFTLPSMYHQYAALVTDVQLQNIAYQVPTDSGAGEAVAQKSIVSVTQGNQTKAVTSISLNLADGTQVTIDQVPPSAIHVHQQFLGHNDDGTYTDKIGDADSANNITWGELLAALANNQSIDVLGSRLSNAKRTLRKSTNAQGDTDKDGNPVATWDAEGGRGPYLEFGRGPGLRRFYISNKPPTPEAGQVIPDGSIGIGWNMT